MTCPGAFDDVRSKLNATPESTVCSSPSPRGWSLVERARKARHPSLYLDNGDVVIFTRGSRNESDAGAVYSQGRCFRVHSFLLTYHSPVFSKMLDGLGGIGSESLRAEEYEGANVLELDDDPEDLASLLRVMYNPGSLPFKRCDPDTPLLVKGIYELALKYQITSFQERIRAHFVSDWPRDYKEWQIRDEEETARLRAFPVDDLRPWPFLDDSFPEPASAVEFGMRFGVTEVLPAAFYQLANLGFDRDWDRFREVESGDGDLKQKIHEEFLKKGGRTARWSLLSREALWCLLQGKEALLAHAKGVEVEMEEALRSHCQSERCASVVRLKREALGLSKGPREGSRRVLHYLAFWLKSVRQWHLCEECVGGITYDIEFLQATTWYKLPEMFGLGRIGSVRRAKSGFLD